MAGEMIANIAKGRMLRALDEYLAVGANRSRALTAMSNGTQFSEILGDDGVWSEDEVSHMITYWFSNTAPAFWPAKELKHEIAQEAYLHALTIADEGSNALPIVTYWLCAGHHFQFAISRSAHQVTVFALTPHRPTGIPTAGVGFLEDVWVVASHADKLELDRQGFASGNTSGFIDGPLLSGVTPESIHLMQLIGDDESSNILIGTTFNQDGVPGS